MEERKSGSGLSGIESIPRKNLGKKLIVLDEKRDNVRTTISGLDTTYMIPESSPGSFLFSFVKRIKTQDISFDLAFTTTSEGMDLGKYYLVVEYYDPRIGGSRRIEKFVFYRRK